MTGLPPPLDPNAVPAVLRERSQWVAWRYVLRKEGVKPTKVPYQPNGEPAKSDDPSTWVSFDEAVAAWRADPSLAGIGYVFSADDPFTGIDLDRSVVDGQLIPGARAIVDAFATFTEVSPSGQGVKLILIGRKPEGAGCAKKHVDGIASVEVYDKLRYFTITGRHLDGTPSAIEERQERLDALCARLWPKRRERQAPAPVAERGRHENIDMAVRERRCVAYLEKCPDAISGQGGHDATLHAACECFRFGLDEDAVWRVMRWFNDRKTGGEAWTDRDLAHKIESAREKVSQAGEVGVRLADSGTAATAGAEPLPTLEGPHGLRLVANSARRTSAKTTVRFDLSHNGVQLTEVQGSNTPTAQRQLGESICAELEGRGVNPDDGVRGDIGRWVRRVLSSESVRLVDARLERIRAAQAPPPNSSPTMVGMATAHLGAAFDFRFAEGSGRGRMAWSEARGDLVSQQEFTALRDPELLARLESARDYAAPTEGDPSKHIKHLGFALPVVWTALTQGLPPEAGESRLDAGSKAAARFREHLERLLLTPEAWSKDAGSLGSRDAPGSVRRTTLAEKASSLAGAAPGAWHRVHPGITVFVGSEGCGSPPLLAIRHTACRYAIRGLTVPGVTDERALAVLAGRYGLLATEGDVPASLAREAGQRGLVVLCPDFATRVMAPDQESTEAPESVASGRQGGMR